MAEHCLLKEFWGRAEFCVCGDPSELARVIRDKLQFCADRFTPGPLADAAFETLRVDPRGPYASPDSYFVHAMLDRWELTEHGGSVFAAWLTAEGRQLLNELNALPLDSEDFDIHEHLEAQ